MAVHERLGAQLAQVLDEVVDERVVVVDDQDPGARHARRGYRPTVGRSRTLDAMADDPATTRPTPTPGPPEPRRKAAASGGKVPADRQAVKKRPEVPGQAGASRATARTGGTATPSGRRSPMRRGQGRAQRNPAKKAAPSPSRAATRRRCRPPHKVSPLVCRSSCSRFLVLGMLVDLPQLHRPVPSGTPPTGACSAASARSSPASSPPPGTADDRPRVRPRVVVSTERDVGGSYIPVTPPSVVHSLWTL